MNVINENQSITKCCALDINIIANNSKRFVSNGNVSRLRATLVICARILFVGGTKTG